jgi:hypothetical protein
MIKEGVEKETRAMQFNTQLSQGLTKFKSGLSIIYDFRDNPYYQHLPIPLFKIPLLKIKKYDGEE